jgi:hypothetical protein
MGDTSKREDLPGKESKRRSFPGLVDGDKGQYFMSLILLVALSLTVHGLKFLFKHNSDI